jgi:hypothetical protein
MTVIHAIQGKDNTRKAGRGRRRLVLFVMSLLLFPLLLPAQTGELDLREANVTAVSFSGNGGTYRFDVTLIHDDAGESGYANWWQVETLAGEQLGRRTLLHPHGTREFTRSEMIRIPSGVEEVVVRGHDQTHGYGGQAMIVNLRTGETEAVRQGPEPRDFSDRG